MDADTLMMSKVHHGKNVRQLYEYKIIVFDNWGTCVWKSEQLEAG